MNINKSDNILKRIEKIKAKIDFYKKKKDVISQLVLFHILEKHINSYNKLSNSFNSVGQYTHQKLYDRLISTINYHN